VKGSGRRCSPPTSQQKKKPHTLLLDRSNLKLISVASLRTQVPSRSRSWAGCLCPGEAGSPTRPRCQLPTAEAKGTCVAWWMPTFSPPEHTKSTGVTPQPCCPQAPSPQMHYPNPQTLQNSAPRRAHIQAPPASSHLREDAASPPPPSPRPGDAPSHQHRGRQSSNQHRC